MCDRSSRPHISPRRTPTRTERRIIKVRLARRWGPARIAHLLHLAPSTVHRVLTRYGLAHPDQATGRVIRRYAREKPGELVHVDIKKLGDILDRVKPGRPTSAPPVLDDAGHNTGTPSTTETPPEATDSTRTAPLTW